MSQQDSPVARRFRVGWVISGIVAAVLVAGCGGDDTTWRPTSASATGSATATETVTVTSSSMAPTLRSGETVTFRPVAAGMYRPHDGDIVLFTPPRDWNSTDRQPRILRVIAIGGQNVACCDPGNRVTVDGQPLDEPYVQPNAGDQPAMPFGPIMVPANRLWLMGDNRAAAVDSRYQTGGPQSATVPLADVTAVLDPPR